MSRTRALIADLRRALGEDAPMPPRIEPTRIPDPPLRIFPKPHRPNRFAQEAAAHTTALVGIGRVGTRYATNVVLQFQAELAVAHAAVAAVVPEGWAEENGLLPLRTRVADRREFLLRPDLGRRLDEPSLKRLRRDAERGVDVQPILADGLSAVALMGSGLELLGHFTDACGARGWTVGTPMCARFARVWLEDEVGQEVGCKVAVILLGERPGLGTGDGLSAYMVHEPRLGKTDGDRNMISNIHRRGIPPERAAERLALMAGAMMDQGTSGVNLDLSSLVTALGGAGGTGLREPQVRQPLVFVGDEGGEPR